MEYKDGISKWKVAFFLVLSGRSYGAVPVAKWKQLLLSLSLVWVISSPVFTYYLSIPYQGSIPEEGAVLKMTGKLIYGFKREGGNNSLQAVLVRDGSGPVEFQDPMGMESVRSWERKTGSDSVYVEGFFLRDGDGLFWPTFISSQDGIPLLSRKEQLHKLSVARAPFGRLLLLMYGLAVPMWIVSIINVRKFKNMIRG
ncbi:hypothetical protein [Burkholderia ambifaria]|uniref:hypothetical protein n=1 Tax=Burkholderia ambifaria TaxID=152480 RepID=UPI001588B3E8|nr:hypothetical protein [Burkholderia ambifaria]MBR8182512.1 hypothetical protein [Burkholderia ambifaria]